ncbi:hypothetical protein [Mesorhizobium sp. M1322]|uniref:hypothetical protein n=1 Tax=Mesorhizobium sp. M1322 TaxID=2957081 RepID=UPI00333B4318
MGAGELVWDSAGEASIASAAATAVVLLGNVIVFSLENGGPNVSASKPNPLLPAWFLATWQMIAVCRFILRAAAEKCSPYSDIAQRFALTAGQKAISDWGPVTLEVADGLGSLTQKVSTFGFLRVSTFCICCVPSLSYAFEHWIFPNPVPTLGPML